MTFSKALTLIKYTEADNNKSTLKDSKKRKELTGQDKCSLNNVIPGRISLSYPDI